MAFLTQQPPIYDQIASVSSQDYTNQLQVSGNSGAVTFTTVEPSTALLVSTGGSLSTTGLLLPGIYSVGGTMSDQGGNTGDWLFQLTVAGVAAAPQMSVTPQQPGPPSNIELAIPFRIDPATGAVAQTSDWTQILAQHLATICLTTPGERLMMPTYGGGIETFIFDPTVEITSGILASDLQKAIQAWEPSAVVDSVNAQPNKFAPNETDVTIVFRPSPVSAQNTITLTVGGTAVQMTAS